MGWLLLACAARDASDGPAVGADSAPPAGDPAGLTWGEVAACAAPRAAPSWADVAEARGMLAAPTDTTAHGPGAGVVVDDLDLDGDFDVVLPYPGGTYVYVREGEGYTVLAHPAPDTYFLPGLADLDGDGRREVLRGGHPPSVLTLVDGAVVERPLTQGPFDPATPSAHGLFPADIDGDGLLDLFVLAGAVELPDYFLRGVGGGWFEPVLDALPADLPNGMGFDVQTFDWDGDLDQDHYVVNDQGSLFGPNVLFENDGGTLVSASESCACGLSMSGMGVDLGDYDRDGVADLYVTETAKASLLRGLPDGTFVDTTRAVGVPPMGRFEMGWGGIFLDLDNDADLDIFEARGDRWDDDTNPELIYDTSASVYVQTDGRFAEAAPELGLDRMGSWRAVVAWDDNGDGVLDLLVTDVLGIPALWLSDGCTANGWLAVEAPVGTKVELFAGGVDQTAWISSHSGMAAWRPPVAHFGLGGAQTVASLVVTLPSGEVRSYQGPFDARRRVTVAP